MQIQIDSDHTVATPEGFTDYVRKTIEQTLHNCKSQITRLEVHLSDENGSKAGSNNKRCVIEARLAGRKPMAVTDQADTLHEVINGATEKLKHAIESILHKEHDHHPRISGEDGIFSDEPIIKDGVARDKKKKLFLKNKIIQTEAIAAVEAKAQLMTDQAHVPGNSN